MDRSSRTGHWTRVARRAPGGPAQRRAPVVGLAAAALVSVLLVSGAGAAPPGAAPAVSPHAASNAIDVPPTDARGVDTDGTTAGRATIRRDEHGIPHVYADTTYDLFHGYGYVVAQDRLFQMEMARRSVLGTAAEVLGERVLANDRTAREAMEEDSIREQLADLPAEHRDVLAGYAAGYNRYVQKVLDEPEELMPKQFTDLDFQPSLVDEFDIAMIWIGTMANRFSDSSSEVENLQVRDQLVAELGAERGGQLFDQLLWIEDPTAPTTVPREAGDAEPSDADANSQTALQGLAPTTESLRDSGAATAQARGGGAWPQDKPTASNLWIVGPERNTTSGSLLLNGPQFDWFNPSYVYGVGLHGAGFDVTGNTPFAYPAVLFGTNQQISWGSTAGPLDVVDIYQESLHPQDEYRYRFQEQWREMERRTETIRVRGGEDIDHEVYSTVHGVVTEWDEEARTAYSKKRSWSGTEVASLMAWVDIMKAQDWDDYLQAAENVGISINWYYADRDGNIGYISPGRLPDRPPEQDQRLPAHGDGSMEWEGFRPFSENPRVYNPEQGYIANWNNQSAAGFGGEGGAWSWVDRVHEITERLEERDRHSPGQVWEINERTSLTDLNIRYLRPHLEDLLADLPADSEPARDARMLLDWDGRTSDDDVDGHYDGPEPTLMRTLIPELTRAVLQDDLPEQIYTAYAETVYAEPGGSQRPAESMKLIHNAFAGPAAGVEQEVDLLNGQDPGSVLREALTAAGEDVRQEHGPETGNWLTPVTPQHYDFQNFMGVDQAGEDEAFSTHQYMNRGTQNNLVTLTPHAPASLCNVAPPGQSGFVAPDGTRSPHYADQLETYTSFDCIHQPLTLKEVLRRSESVEVLE